MLKPLSDYEFIDVHYHADPDLYERRHNAIEVGKIYQAHNGAVVLKSHLGSTAVQATLAQAQGYPVLPSVVLNDIAGGIDHKVVVRALIEYKPMIQGRVLVHFPTITGRKLRSKLTRQISGSQYSSLSFKPLTVFDDNQRLKPEVITLIKMSANEPIVLSTGHASKEETYALIDECGKYHHARLMLNQPANPLTGLSASELLEISKLPYVFIEQTALTYLVGHQSRDDFKQVLKTIPNVLYSSDLGQTSQMDVADYLKQSQAYFNAFEINEERVKLVWKQTPLKLLQL